MRSFVAAMPKVELHVHIEGTLEPELMLDLAARNDLELPFDSIDDEGTAVLRTERDFFDLTWHYLRRAHRDAVRHAEIFFDPQAHTERGVAIEAVIEGIDAACKRAEQELQLSTHLILCFLRHLDQDAALRTLDQAMPFRDRFVGVGLDSTERGNPPSKFERVFARARGEGLRAVAHAGEEGPPEYIRGALDTLKVERIDHGVRCLEDADLVRRLVDEEIPLTVCPLSNVKLGIFAELSQHCLPELLRRGVRATINSDDPAYFGGYIGDNFVACREALSLSDHDWYSLASNAIRASFLDPYRKRVLHAEVDEYFRDHGRAPR
jgi:adenosine deaminase